ncbi:PCID2 [Symbiodinium pilosum]|uniref:PCID2 protein n=1 Tax=Symbiodinium pilosum TaxID=2952 RepID=A0A812TDQ8_SYMPI|nr:PCID2 [Symbiodinium pilosum]
MWSNSYNQRQQMPDESKRVRVVERPEKTTIKVFENKPVISVAKVAALIVYLQLSTNTREVPFTDDQCDALATEIGAFGRKLTYDYPLCKLVVKERCWVKIGTSLPSRAISPCRGFVELALEIPEIVAMRLAQISYGCAKKMMGFEANLEALRLWAKRYLDRNDKVRWMLAPMLWMAARTRQLAVTLDKAEDPSRYRNKLVEELRTLFTKLHQDRARREGALVMCCELLRLYRNLGQASQCPFVLTSVGNILREDKFDPSRIPKSMLVTLYFLWGKHLVLEGKIIEAEEKLSSALTLCPPKAAGNRQRILAYLIPCRLRLGRYPARGVLERNGLESLAGLVVATAAGNVRRFNEELVRQEADLITLGTYLVIEKLKVVAYRNLTRHVFDHQSEKLEPAQRVKQDFAPYERAFRWQDPRCLREPQIASTAG